MSGLKKVWKKVTKVLVKGDLGYAALKSMGMSTPGGDLMYGDNKLLTPAEKNQQMQQEQMEAQTRASDDAMKQQALFDEQASRIASNQAALQGSNAAQDTTRFELGGSDTPDGILEDMRRRRNKGSSTSSQLGII
jgi:hypothetical protein